MQRRFIIFAVRLIYRLISRIEVTGLENLPLDRPLILTANHIGTLDAPSILTIPQLIEMEKLIVLVAEKYKKLWVYRWAVGQLGFLWIDRFGDDFVTLKEVIRRLQDGGLLIIAPEGTRSPTASLMEGKPGTAYLAAKTGATILPISTTGTEDRALNEGLRRFKRLRIHIRIGKPYKIPPLPRVGRDEFLHQQTEEIMCRIAAILPVEYRGVYANHPRLAVLLSG